MSQIGSITNQALSTHKQIVENASKTLGNENLLGNFGARMEKALDSVADAQKIAADTTRNFELGNEKIVENSSNPGDREIVRVINSNIQTLVNNYKVYLNWLVKENSYSQDGLNRISDLISSIFVKLIKDYPDADYKAFKAELLSLSNKTKSKQLNLALNAVIEEIDNIN